MPRTESVDELLIIAKRADLAEAKHLYLELQQLEPNGLVVTAFLEALPAVAQQENETGLIALHFACANIDNIPMEMLEYLIEIYPDGAKKANKHGLLPIHKACAAFSSTRALKNIITLIDHYPDGLLAPNRDGQLPLHIAVANPKTNSPLLVQHLVDRCPRSVKVPDRYGHFPLHKAASKAHKTDGSLIDILLKCCSDIASLHDHNGWIPLHWILARENPNMDAFYLLVESYPEGLFAADYENFLPFDKLIQRGSVDKETKQAVMETMEVTRQQMSRTNQEILQRNTKRVPSPSLLAFDYYDSF